MAMMIILVTVVITSIIYLLILPITALIYGFSSVVFERCVAVYPLLVCIGACIVRYYTCAAVV